MALLRFVLLNFLLADLIGLFSSAYVNLNDGREIFLDYSNGKKMGHGYLMRNKRILMSQPIVVNGKMASKNMVEKIMANDDLPIPTTTFPTTTIETSFLQDQPPICFQIMKHRNLLHGNFITLNRPVTRNECR
uniref:Uncharacterized protein n=1 Tax=Acrobeloides nanus TaxID=290746 RepID=A0A914CIB4_9BILA